MKRLSAIGEIVEAVDEKVAFGEELVGVVLDQAPKASTLTPKKVGELQIGSDRSQYARSFIMASMPQSFAALVLVLLVACTRSEQPVKAALPASADTPDDAASTGFGEPRPANPDDADATKATPRIVPCSTDVDCLTCATPTDCRCTFAARDVGCPGQLDDCAVDPCEYHQARCAHPFTQESGTGQCVMPPRDGPCRTDADCELRRHPWRCDYAAVLKGAPHGEAPFELGCAGMPPIGDRHAACDPGPRRCVLRSGPTEGGR